MNESEKELYEKKIKDLEDTIKVLEESKKDAIETKLLKNTDEYAVKFIRNLNKDDMYFATTKELFDSFLSFRRQYTTRNEELISMRMFNNTVKSFFPTAEVRHSNKNGKNVYYWSVE